METGTCDGCDGRAATEQAGRASASSPSGSGVWGRSPQRKPVTPWWQGIEPVTAPVGCGRSEHTVTWRRGRLVLDDHPGLTAERALVALGGDAGGCLDVLSAWGSAGPDPRLAARFTWLVGRWPAIDDPLDRPPPVPVAAAGPGPRQRAYEQVRRQAVIEALPPELVVRWLLGATTALDRRWGTLSDDGRSHLQLVVAAAANRGAARCIRSWQRLARVQRLAIDCRLLPPGRAPAMTGRVDGALARAEVELPLSWLRRVWARGAVVVDGCFVLDAGPESDRAEVVRWERREPGVAEAVAVPARLWRDGDRRGGTWHLRWA